MDIPSALSEHGFAVIEPVLVLEELELLRASLGKITAGERRGGLRDALRRIPAVQHCAFDPRILGLAQSVLGAGARPVKGIVFDKTPAANWKVPWHQDLTICVERRIEVDGFGPWSVKEGILHVQPPVEILERILAIRVHLDDAGPDNGALRVLPGTHRSGRLGEVEIERLRVEVPEVVCGVRAGGAMLMRPPAPCVVALSPAGSPPCAPHRIQRGPIAGRLGVEGVGCARLCQAILIMERMRQ